jgi:hypothetical protein
MTKDNLYPKGTKDDEMENEYRRTAREFIYTSFWACRRKFTFTMITVNILEARRNSLLTLP